MGNVRPSLGTVVMTAVALAACTESGAEGASPTLRSTQNELQAHWPSHRVANGGSAAPAQAGAAGSVPPGGPGGTASGDDDAGSSLPPTSACADDADADAGAAAYTLAAPRPIVRITASDFHTCVVLSDQRVLCWGMNTLGENNTTIAHKSDTAEWVPWLTGAQELTAGRGHSCFLEGGEALCYGINYYGELGDGTKDSSAKPVKVALQSSAKALALGEQFSCALIEDGSVQCWGGWRGTDTLPQQVLGAGAATAISARGGRACAVTPAQHVACFSDHDWVPYPIDNLEGATKLAATAAGGCAVLANHDVACWTGSAAAPLADTHDVVSVSAGDYSTCALFADGRVRCWGRNTYGELGNGTGDSTSSPTYVPTVADVKLLAGGAGHYCAVRRDDSVQCWGFGLDGELGNGERANSNRAVNVLFPGN